MKIVLQDEQGLLPPGEGRELIGSCVEVPDHSDSYAVQLSPHPGYTITANFLRMGRQDEQGNEIFEVIDVSQRSF